MLYLANPSKGPVRDAMAAGIIGQLNTPAQGNLIYGQWGADTGCFGKGYPGDDAYLAWLERKIDHVDTCLFATAPDVVGDAAATLERSRPMLPKIRALGYPAGFVAQNGIEHTDIPWGDFDVLFLGGAPECRHCDWVAPIITGEKPSATCPVCRRWLTEWKLGPVAIDLIREAQRRCKKVHMGRVNSKRRWDFAEYHGVDYCDGTFLTFGRDKNLARLKRWLQPKPPGLFDGIDVLDHPDDIHEESA